MTATPVEKAISAVSPRPGQLFVSVRFKNVSDFDVFVLRDEPFLFVTSGPSAIDDIGPSEKRAPYTLADYERLAPGQMTMRGRDIASQFAWLPGTHTYEVSVSGDYEDPVDGRAWKGPRVSGSFSWTKAP